MTQVKAVHFSKMHGLGNDFMVINNLNQQLDISTWSIPTLANRHLGIGFDQLLVIEPSQGADFFCRIYNADGSEAEQCGNGLRCVARFIVENQLHNDSKLAIETIAGLFAIDITNYDQITVNMGIPKITADVIHLTVTHAPTLELTTLSIGNPHAVIQVTSIDAAWIEQAGPALSTHAHFPCGANIGFMEIVNRKHVRLRTFERGSGETWACGSNACATAITGILRGWLDHTVEIEFRYGVLKIKWEGENQPVFMTGPATLVFNGEYVLPSMP